MELMCHNFCIYANNFFAILQIIFLDFLCMLAKVPIMKTKEAIDLAGGRKQLAALLGVASITTYRWKEYLALNHEDRLRVLRPKWFKQQKEKKQ